MASGTFGWPTGMCTRARPITFEPFTVMQNEGGKFSTVLHYPDMPDNSYRGGCAGDFDNDGRMDVVVLPIAGQPLSVSKQDVQLEFLGWSAPARYAQ